MKGARLFFVISAVLLLFCSFSISGNAERSEERLVLKYIGGEYLLLNGEEGVYRGRNVSEAISLCAGVEVYFDNLRIFEDVEIPKGEYSFSGKAFFEGDSGISVGNDTYLQLCEFSCDFAGGYVSVLGGELSIVDSTLEAGGEYTVNCESGDITVLGDSKIIGERYGIKGNAKIKLYDESGKRYEGEKLTFCYTGESRSFYDAFSVKKGEVVSVEVYNTAGERLPVYRVDFLMRDGVLYSEQRFSGESLKPPSIESVTGYELLGWTVDGRLSQGDSAVRSNIVAYPSYVLKPPEAKVKGVDFTYDGEERILDAVGIYHPLLPYGALSYAWYFEDRLVSTERWVSVSDVSDSGLYSLVLSFEYAGEKSTLEIENIEVKISARTLTLEYDDGDFIIVNGGVAEGDDIEISGVEIDGKIHAQINDSNYCLDFSPINSKNRKIQIGVFVSALTVLAMLVLASFWVFKSDEKDRMIRAIAQRRDQVREDEHFVNPTVNFTEDGAYIEKNFFAVDKERADELISDRLAKNMIFHGGSVQSSGSGCASVSLGRIDEAFLDGDEVDLGRLKENGICPSDSFKIKVIAEGTLSKSFTVYANEFDIAAVKMIALSGGRAVRVKSKKKRA